MTGSALAQLRDTLEKLKLHDVAKDGQDVVSLQHNQTVGDALRVLAKYRILSAPLVITPDLEDINMADDGTLCTTLLGWVDIIDIIAALIQHLKTVAKPAMPTSMLQLLSLLETEAPEFVDKMLITIMGGQDKNLVYQADADISLLAALKDNFFNAREMDVDSGGDAVLRRGDRAVHRIAIFDSHGGVISVISQMDCLVYLHNNPEYLGAAADLTIEQLGILKDKRELVAVDAHMPTLLAYDRMLQQGVSAVAVLAPSGDLMANLSASDMRCIQPDHLGVLALPVAEFLALLHGTTYMGYSAAPASTIGTQHPFFASPRGQPPAVDLISCGPSTTLKQVLDLMVRNRVHRVYLMQPDAPKRAVAMITTTDILGAFVLS